MNEQVIYYGSVELNETEGDIEGSTRLLSPIVKPVPMSKRKLKKRSQRLILKKHKDVLEIVNYFSPDRVREQEKRFGLNRFSYDMDDYLRWTYRKGELLPRCIGCCNTFLKK